ncbi:ATP-binding protein [Caulobacter sp. FWC2]|uniref:ATP-binding protein n=1 Tax=Caulobacter sp. FWC2 TaxID=69664 RepID=UPI000C152D45|nr:ATP-binding protein [Caulobacter sp. FWC2]PIB93437.1 PAS domain-containing sensor histidine kinase [Caulobacter sp. FWC2]
MAGSEPRRNVNRWLIGVAGLTAAGIFAADLLTALQGAVAVLYIAVVLLVAQTGGRRLVVSSGVIAALLTIIAFVANHRSGPLDGAAVRFGVSLVAIIATTLLSLRDWSARLTLAEQARMLELTHDTVIIRDSQDRIVYWNDGAEALYGFARKEAVGAFGNQLLNCQFPAAVVTEALEREGQWSGQVVRTRRDGSRLVLASRWLLRRDPDGRPVGIIETSADLTEQRRVEAEREMSEQRYRAMFNAAGFAAWESDWSAVRRRLLETSPDLTQLAQRLPDDPNAVREAASLANIRDLNQAALDLFEAASAEGVIGGSLISSYPEEAQHALHDIFCALAEGATMAESETRLTTRTGRPIDVVLRITLVEGGEPWSRVLVMAFDVTERNAARARLEHASAELAHAGRVSILGQLAASIAHEVNQPLAAIINYGKSAKRWLNRDAPEVAEAQTCLDHILSNSGRAADIIAGVRNLSRKSAGQVEPVDLAQLLRESLSLVQREAKAARATIRSVIADELPSVIGDRVQIQQVVVNLLINGLQAMQASRRRELDVTLSADGDFLRVAVTDSGPGISGEPGRIFEPFFTTKPDGVGLGLSISRSIIEGLGGRISAANNVGSGATIAFTLPRSPAAAN